MVITLTKSAVNKLETIKLKEEYSPRIDAIVAGGCGMSIKFMLVFEEPRRNDSILEYSGIKIRIDHFTKRYLNEETEIDFTEEHGFLVGENFASSACAIEVD